MNPVRGKHRGFTLIEIAVVLVLMALLASVAAVSARGMIGGATQQEALAQIESLDAQARRQARQTSQSVQLELDTANSRFMLSTSDARGGSMVVARYELPSDYELGHAWRWWRGQREQQNTLALTYDTQGIAPTWGVTLTRADDDDPVVLMVLGETGQLIALENDEQAQDIMARVHRRDAD